ncbi:B3/B4 domain-containing protein [Variovorax ginsengisoli]|uniref:B3/B4 domain-containing protein n=1 Tax=Variovorax ginsengisoli TaxID=363844 RepID=UPI0035214D1D
MLFSYAPCIHRDFPELASRVLRLEGVTPAAPAADPVARFIALAKQRIALTAESDLPEIQAWRRAFGKMGLKPTQYRCASEALLRRLRKEGDLPSVHPLVDLCNAASAAFAIPIAAIDLDRIDGNLQVRPAIGTEIYETFAGDIEHPEVGEIIFADESDRAHARRWANRQSGHSAVMDRTTHALIVAEAMHDTAATDVARLIATLRTTISVLWPCATLTEVQVP